MSGVPGRSRRCNRKRSPRRCKAFRTSNSGEVFFERIAVIFRERSGVGVDMRGSASGVETVADFMCGLLYDLQANLEGFEA